MPTERERNAFNPVKCLKTKHEKPVQYSAGAYLSSIVNDRTSTSERAALGLKIALDFEAVCQTASRAQPQHRRTLDAGGLSEVLSIFFFTDLLPHC